MESGGVGGEGVEGHVGRMVGRSEGIAQIFGHEFHECAHRSSVGIDSDQNYDGDDNDTSTHHDIKSLIKSPTNSQQQQPTDNNHGRQQDNDLKRPRTTTSNDDDKQRQHNHSNKQARSCSTPTLASCSANEPRPKALGFPLCAPTERRPFSGVPHMAAKFLTEKAPQDVEHSSSRNLKAAVGQASFGTSFSKRRGHRK